MTYATVMVSLALDQPNDSRLQVAGELAERFEAAIVGVAAAQFAPPLYFTDGAEAQGLIDQEVASIKRRLADLEAQFRAATQNRGGRAEWRSAMDFPAQFVQARCADIVVSGGQSPAFSDAFSLASPEDALPMLRKARHVTIVEIPEGDDDCSAVMAGVTDVAAWLARHSITATARVSDKVRNQTAAAQLEKVAGDVGAGLIVAGAYGHSRFRELILGGVTQYLVTQSARCVLLSH